MSNKELFCYRILKAHSIIIDFEGVPRRKTVPSPVSGETFKQWKLRVLGEDVGNVVVYAPYEPAPQTKISTLQNCSGAQHLERVFARLSRDKDQKKVEAVKRAVSETEREYTTFPKETLAIILDEIEEDIEDSVKEFVSRFLNSTEDDVNAEDLLISLIERYNAVAKRYREVSV